MTRPLTLDARDAIDRALSDVAEPGIAIIEAIALVRTLERWISELRESLGMDVPNPVAGVIVRPDDLRDLLRLVTDANPEIDQSGPVYAALVRLWTVLP